MGVKLDVMGVLYGSQQADGSTFYDLTLVVAFRKAFRAAELVC